MLYELKLKLSWNKVAHVKVEAKDKKELETKLPQWWLKQLRGNRTQAKECNND